MDAICLVFFPVHGVGGKCLVQSISWRQIKCGLGEPFSAALVDLCIERPVTQGNHGSKFIQSMAWVHHGGVNLAGL